MLFYKRVPKEYKPRTYNFELSKELADVRAFVCVCVCVCARARARMWVCVCVCECVCNKHIRRQKTLSLSQVSVERVLVPFLSQSEVCVFCAIFKSEWSLTHTHTTPEFISSHLRMHCLSICLWWLCVPSVENELTEYLGCVSPQLRMNWLCGLCVPSVENELTEYLWWLCPLYCVQWIWQDNMQYLKDRNLFEHSYFK